MKIIYGYQILVKLFMLQMIQLFLLINILLEKIILIMKKYTDIIDFIVIYYVKYLILIVMSSILPDPSV